MLLLRLPFQGERAMFTVEIWNGFVWIEFDFAANKGQALAYANLLPTGTVWKIVNEFGTIVA